MGQFIWTCLGFAAIGVAAYWYGKSKEFKAPKEEPFMFEYSGLLYDKRYWTVNKELGIAVEKKWWDPTYGLPYASAAELPEEERRKLRGWNSDGV